MKEQGPGRPSNLTNFVDLSRLNREHMDNNFEMPPGAESPMEAIPTGPIVETMDRPDLPGKELEDILAQTQFSTRDPAEQRKLIEFQSILADQNLVRVMSESSLGSGTPEIENLKKFMNTKLDPNNYQEYGRLAEAVINSNISQKGKEFLFEWMLEKVIGAADWANEYTEYNIGSYLVQYSLDALRIVAQRGVAEEKISQHFFSYMEELKHIRPLAHKIHLLATYGKGFDDYLAEGHLRSTSLDFMYNDIVGVSWVKMQLEKLFGGRVGETSTVLNHGDLKLIRNDLEDQMQTANELGLICAEGRKLTGWELQRALRMGLAFFEGTQRGGVYSGMGNIPPSSGTVERIASELYEYIGRKIYNSKLIGARFFGDSERKGSRYLIREFLKTVLERDSQKYLGLFGIDRRIEALNAYGAQDMETHSWRLQELFFGNIRFLKDGENTNLLNELIAFARKNDPSISEGETLGGESLNTKGKEKLYEDFKEIVLGQRLYLSVLSRYGNFTGEFKEQIFQKIAILKPSTIAAMFPELIKEGTGPGVKINPTWESLKKVLYLAELERVKEDADAQQDRNNRLSRKEDVSAGYMEEYHSFLGANAEISQGSGSYAFQMVERCRKMAEKMGVEGWKEGGAEEQLLKQIITKGFNNAKALSKAQFSQSIFIDDAPVENWRKTGEGFVGISDEDALRILISDQKNLVEACGGLNHLLESPHIFKTFSEGLTQFVEKWGEVHGRRPAQQKIDPVVRAWINMARTKDWILWTPGAKTIMDWFKIPSSVMERFYRTSEISLDEEDIFKSLKAMSQANTISDNPEDKYEKGKKGETYTQFEMLVKDLGASRKKRMFRMFRFIAIIFGPAFAKALFGNLVKDL